MIIGLMVFAPFFVGLATAFTMGWGGAAGLIGLAIVAVKMDVTPKAHRFWLAPKPNLPPEEV
jgi:hypothetical protein